MPLNYMKSSSGWNSVDELVSMHPLVSERTDATTGVKTKMDSISAKVYYRC
jgi:hypothetical protein